jgi:hypothetical protein
VKPSRQRQQKQAPAHELYRPFPLPFPQANTPEAKSFLAVFQWLYQLDPQNLKVEAGLEDHRATFTASNWQDIPAFAADAHECLDGSIILHLHPPGVDLLTVTGLQLIDQEWNIIRPEYLKHYTSSTETEAVSFANILDIYPDCPVPAGNLVPE